MALSRDDVRGIAEYVRIALTEDELDEMTSYMNEAIQMLQPIREYDLKGVDPTFHPIGDLSNVMAADEPNMNGRSLGLEAALCNAGAVRDRSYRVPSILGDEGGDR